VHIVQLAAAKAHVQRVAAAVHATRVQAQGTHQSVVLGATTPVQQQQ
jgi:hypothetical protein